MSGLPLSLDFPRWLKPEIFPGLPIRWYGLMYVVAFATAFLAYRRQVAERRFPMTADDLSLLFFWGILGLLVGARLFATLVYETSDIYRRQPWLIFWPFRAGRYTGLQGMSYHGGWIGGILGVLFYCIKRKWDWREIADMYACSIPLGYTFGRIGNFINGELFGRLTASPLGMVFPAGAVSTTGRGGEAIKAWAVEHGFEVSGAMVNLPRHPSQLYESLFEGVVLWALLWLFRNKKPFRGFMIGMYTIGYGLIRFFIEYFREPDAELGYRIEFVRNTLPIEIAHPLTSLSTGQLFCLFMIASGLLWLLIASRLPGRAPFVAPPEGAPPAPLRTASERKASQNERRHRRRRLR